ncbi:MAG: histidine phosphotransferase family protein [Alphaproteobacteria bacterium]|nr:histidine phosphotransferase family protein [Alphaproteobacteria bacterium]
MIDELRMAELLSTRLCHDLTGPIGAVNNGAEFLSEEGAGMQAQAVELITSSAFSAVSRLQFYRMAYGHVKDQGEANLSEKQRIAADFFTGSKISLDWPDSHTEAADVSISVKMSRLIFNLLIVASSTLIRGGKLMVRIRQDEAGQRHVSVQASGAGLKWEPEMEHMLSGAVETSQLSPKNVQVYLTRRFAEDLRSRVEYRIGADEMELLVVQPRAQQG